MRQRKVISDEDVVSSQPVLRRVAAVDMFPKPKEDFQRQQTTAGATVSMVTVGVIVALLLWEGIGYCVGWNAYDTDLTIDGNMNRSMDVNIDITFPRNPCSSLSVNVRDAAGSRRINVTRSLQKIPLTSRGDSAYVGRIFEVGEESDESESCKSCFLSQDVASIKGQVDSEGKLHTSKCCFTCDDVTKAYEAANLLEPPQNAIPQCLSELAKTNPGCRVVGTLHLKKISGTLVFAPRQTSSGYKLDELLRFRSDHRINRLVIGNPRVKRFSKQGTISQLEGHEYKNDRYLSEVRYFLSVVPTTYNSKTRQPSDVRTYEYAVQFHSRKLLIGYDGIPSVIFGFDFSPIQIDNYFRRPPVAQFAIKLCGIVGGLFVVLGIVDRVIARVAC